MTETQEVIDGEVAAYNVLSLVTKGKMTTVPVVGRYVSFTNTRICAGCALCIDACNYGARYIDYDDDKVVKVREILCDGCAACVNACPSGAAGVRSLEVKSILNMIDNEALK